MRSCIFVLSAAAALSCAGGAPVDRLGALCDAGWGEMMSTRWHAGTGLVYGRVPDQVRTSKGAVNWMFPWKDKVGYGYGMSDCALVCGTALSGLVDREAVLRDGSSKAQADKVARGMLNLAKLHGVRGFVARGICPDDGRTICSLSSRDQVTHWVHGLWRYVNSPLSDPELAAEYRALVADVAWRMETRATEANGWDFGQADGTPDPRGICTMWGPGLLPHEQARLPMVYAAAYEATKDGHWLGLYERFIDEALDKTLLIEGDGRGACLKVMPNYAMYQANASLELIIAHETNSVRRAKATAALGAFARIAASRAEPCLGKPESKQYGMCWDGELLLAMLMAPERMRPKWLPRFLEEAVLRSDLKTSGTPRAAHVMAAFWRSRAHEGRSRKTSSEQNKAVVEVVPCERWSRLDFRKDVVPGSALDFSGMGLQDAPAGKYGWLKNVGGHFEFEGMPDVEQRFYGVNLCYAANYLSHDDADMLVDRLVRCGYNTIRVHHHDGDWEKSEKNREELDYLIAQAIKKGLYITTDLYVSRPVKWRAIGIDRDGDMGKQLYKTYIGIYEPAFSNWCVHARAFLEHVNPYTGRAYKDEPAMPLISLVNEGKLGMRWDDKKNDERLAAAWHAFGGEGAPPAPTSGKTLLEHRRFNEWINRRVWERCSGYVKGLGARALLTNDNNGRWHGESESLTPCYDYVDNHFYVDHPKFLERRWQLPSKCENRNPILCGEPCLLYQSYAKGASRPYTITEWNFSGPGRYRAMGGILTGALASEQDWDGLWRFAYSHSNRNLKDNSQDGPGYFDCVTDPLIAASDRASVCLYLRRDAEAGSLKEDKENGSMTLVSSRTCGGFAESGTIDAGPLSFAICTNDVARRIVPTTLWVSSIDGKPVTKSSRMLLTHLTDVQGAGVKFMDETRKVLLKWGKGCLVESGAAEVSLRLDKPERYQVWALASDGERRFAMSRRVENGALCFTASTRGADGKGVVQYEILREK